MSYNQNYGGFGGYPGQGQGPPPPYAGGGQPPYPGQGFPGQQGYPGQGFPSQQMPPPMGFHIPIDPEANRQQEPKYEGPRGGQGSEYAGMEFSDKTIRMAFIRKVYSILMLQLLVTLGLIALWSYHPGVKDWTNRNTWFFIVVFIGAIVLMFTLACCEGVRRKSPGNFICLGLFTVFEGILLGVISSRYAHEEVLLAAGITATICLALTLFSFQTKWDFTAMGGILFVAMIILLLFGILAMFFDTLRVVYACLGALLFSIYLVYDTQLMMGGKKKYSISPEEYIFAALNLYMDIINIFMYILAIVGSRD